VSWRPEHAFLLGRAPDQVVAPEPDAESEAVPA
jgi:hypothetical protein